MHDGKWIGTKARLASFLLYKRGAMFNLFGYYFNSKLISWPGGSQREREKERVWKINAASEGKGLGTSNAYLWQIQGLGGATDDFACLYLLFCPFL